MIGRSEDAFGAALVDYLEGREVPGLVLEEQGFGAGPAMHPEWFFRGYERWDWWDRQLLPLIGQGPVLDLGAGAGRASLYLQDRGLAVTAIDASPGAVQVCRRRGGWRMPAGVMSVIRPRTSGGRGCCCYAGIWAWAAPGKGTGGCRPDHGLTMIAEVSPPRVWCPRPEVPDQLISDSRTLTVEWVTGL